MLTLKQPWLELCCLVEAAPVPREQGNGREWRKGSQEAESKHRWGLTQGQGLSSPEDFKGVKPH